MDNKFTSSKNTEKRKFSDKKFSGERRSSSDAGKRGSFNKSSSRFSKERKSYDDKNMNPEKRGYSDRSASSFRDRKPYSEDKPYKERKYGERSSSYNQDKPYSERKSSRPSYGDKPYSNRKPENINRNEPFNKDREQGNSRFSNTERKPRFEKRYSENKGEYSDKSRYSDKGRFADKGSRFADKDAKYSDRGNRFSDKGAKYSEKSSRFADKGGNRYSDKGGNRYSDKGGYSDKGRFADKGRSSERSGYGDRNSRGSKGGYSSKRTDNKRFEGSSFKAKDAVISENNDEIINDIAVSADKKPEVKVEQPIEKAAATPKHAKKEEANSLDKKLETVLHLLINVDKNGKNLKESLETNETYQSFDKHSKIFIRRVTQGVFEKRLTLDKIISDLVAGQKIKVWLMEILRIIAYRILYTKSDVNEVIFQGVELCKKYVSPELASYTTAIARKLERNKNEYDPENRTYKNSIERIAYIYAWPTEIVSGWVKNYGQENAVLLASQKIKNKGVAYMKSLDEEDNDTLIYEMEDNNISHSKGIVNRTIFFDDISVVKDMTVYKEGKLVIRSLGAILAAKILDAGKNDKVMIVGKNSENIRDSIMDRSEANAKITVTDGSDDFDASYNKIIVVPESSAIGTVASAPEIKARLDVNNIAQYTSAQREALNVAFNNLAANGVMIYFTTTVSSAENEDMVNAFISENPALEVMDIDNLIPDGLKYIKLGKMLLVLPDDVNSEAFFIAAMRKK